VLKCYAKAAGKGLPLDTTCTGGASTKFGASWTKATAAADCNTTVSQGAIETKIDNFAADVNSELTAAGPTTTTTSTTPGSTTTTSMPGPCCGINPTKLNFTTGMGTGNCGTLKNSAGGLIQNLACGGLYTGGGSNSVPLPFAIPDLGSSLTKVSACSGTSLTLANLTSTQTGNNNRNCTSVGCLFGPPLPIPNTASTPTSVCVINSVTTNASGTADCMSGASHLSLPLNSELFLDGDLLAARPGIQVCPVCLGNACVGGANNGADCTLPADCPGGSCVTATVCHTLTTEASNGAPCTPADSLNPSFPTSDDCPPPRRSWTSAASRSPST